MPEPTARQECWPPVPGLSGAILQCPQRMVLHGMQGASCCGPGNDGAPKHRNCPSCSGSPMSCPLHRLALRKVPVSTWPHAKGHTRGYTAEMISSCAHIAPPTVCISPGSSGVCTAAPGHPTTQRPATQLRGPQATSATLIALRGHTAHESAARAVWEPWQGPRRSGS